ncbi:unnamed protein product [Lathyrus sativus]|nr:unnamed protein product [Lathyrus sativus]
MDAFLLFPETHSISTTLSILIVRKPIQQNRKPFDLIVSNNVCDIMLSQLSTPCLKGDRLTITILEYEYNLGVEAFKHHLHGRVFWSKGLTLLTVVNLKNKLMEMWLLIENGVLLHWGKGFFEFPFSLDVQRVRSVNARTMSQGVLKLFPWSKDFVPSTIKQTSA